MQRPQSRLHFRVVELFRPSELVEFCPDALERQGQRKTRPDAGVAALARDEDTEFSSPAPSRRRALPWVLAGASAIAVSVVAVVVTLFATGVL